MSTDAKKVGDIFRATRIEKHLSLKEVESNTSIRTNYLEAIEEGRVEQFLSTVYMYGFMRQYAVFLGLDMERLSRDYPEVFRRKEQIHDFAYGIGSLEVRHGTSHGFRWMPNFLWIGAGGVVLLLAWWLAKALGVL